MRSVDGEGLTFWECPNMHLDEVLFRWLL